MEHGTVNLKFVLAGVLVGFMLCIAAVLAMAAPAMAQGGGASSVTGDASVDNSVDAQYTSVNTNICSNFAQGQYVGGDLIIGEGGVNNVINQCIAAGFLPEDGGGGDGTNPPANNNDVSSDTTCPNPTEAASVNTASGTDTFPATAGETYQVTYDVDDDSAEPLSITIAQDGGDNVFDEEVTEDGSQILNDLTEAGDYTLTVETDDADATFTVTVQECGEEAEANNAANNGNPQANVIAATIPAKVLANTGGVSASATLLPAGALLMAFGAMTFCVRSWRA